MGIVVLTAIVLAGIAGEFAIASYARRRAEEHEQAVAERLTRYAGSQGEGARK